MEYNSILLVDDDPDDLLVFTEGILCIRENARCLTAKNGKEALDVLKHFVPDLIISDINMPVMDGVAFLQYLRTELQLTTPVVIVSTSAFEKNKVLSLGANYFFTKCNSLREMNEQLKTVMSLSFTHS